MTFDAILKLLILSTTPFYSNREQSARPSLGASSLETQRIVDSRHLQIDTGAYLASSDPGPNSDFDFNNGDAITLEAWVNPSVLRDGQVGYIVGKKPSQAASNYFSASGILCQDFLDDAGMFDTG
jgi:hypothetical protein